MKKLMYFAVALLVLAGCNKKDNALNNAPEGTPFKKGQRVTLSVGTGDNANQAAPRKVAGIDNGTNINFAWEVGDKILVKVGDATAEFTLISGEGTDAGEFAGEMPADGSTFDIYYPVEMSDLSEQVYTADEPIPADKMDFAASNCTLGNPVILTALNAMLQLNLYGTDITIGKIVFTNTNSFGASPLTLTCTDGVTIGTDAANATPFYMVVPAGEYQFEVEVYDNDDTPAKICSFAPSADKTFVAGECLNMPAKEVAVPKTYENGHEYVDLGLSVKWASMNVGATKAEEYGYYVMWGETSPRTGENYSWSTYKYCNGNDYSMTKYCVTDSKGTIDNKTTLEPEDDAAHVNWGGAWRTPTLTEATELVDNCTWAWTDNYNGTGIKGYIITSNIAGYTDKSIFLPAAGYCLSGQSNDVIDAGGRGDYWVSSLNTTNSSLALGFAFYHHPEQDDVKHGAYGDYYRCDGHTVRPVCQ